MHQLYLEQCKGEIPEKDSVSQSVYRKVFNEEYNFSLWFMFATLVCTQINTSLLVSQSIMDK
jgi:hypothetical protein